MADKLELPEWMEWALNRLVLGLVVFGGGAFVLGVAALFGGINPDFSPLYLLIGGPVAAVVGVGLYFHQTWSIVLALVPCLGVSAMIGMRIASGEVNLANMEFKAIVFPFILVALDAALLGMLFLRIQHNREHAPKRSAVNKHVGNYRLENGSELHSLTLRADGSARHTKMNTKFPEDTMATEFTHWEFFQDGRTLLLSSPGQGGDMEFQNFAKLFKRV